MCVVIYVVKPGDNLYEIARRYGVPYTKIVRDNELSDPSRLAVGQTLVILRGLRTHIIRPGESIYSISRIYGIPVRDILAANPQITSPNQLYIGQVINIPEEKKLGTIDVNGYALPGIDMEVLRKALPYLSYLSIFSYEVRADGSLKPIEDEELIRAARAARVAPIMVVSNIAEGGFSSDLARTIFTNQQVRDTLINNIIKTMRDKNYAGLDMDFEFIYPENKEDYNNFLRVVVKRLEDEGYNITATAVAPKESGEMQGLLYTAHDYPVHGALVDHVIIMTYEWGYVAGPPLAVAPINEVEKIIKYAVSAIPSRKILMGIPNYGYDWTLPYTSGTRARTLSIVQANDLAIREGAAIQYDTKSQAPFFYYFDDAGRQHVVWFEDARSIEAKLLLANQYKLGGVSYWTINKYFPQNWLVLSSMFNIRKLL